MLLQMFFGVSVISFLAFSIWRVIKYRAIPLHLRWELYPVPRETKRPWGGSYHEDVDWRNTPRRRGWLGEMKTFAGEILLFRLYFLQNRKYWFSVYPFHIGFFSFLGWLFWLLAGAALSLAGVAVSASSLNIVGRIVSYLTVFCGAVGSVLGTVGCLSLLARRILDKELRMYSAPLGYFNLAFIAATFLSSLVGWAFVDPTFAGLREFMKSPFMPAGGAALVPALHLNVILISLFLMYMPFTSMRHAVAKYFTFHKVRWDDEPNIVGSRIEKKVIAQLNVATTWSAPHIQTGKTWADVCSPAAAEPIQKTK